MSSVDGIMVVGLTGQTGAGKSTVSKIFAEHGFEVINADMVARKVVEVGKPCLAEIAELFGSSVINDDGSLNRRALGQIVFCNKTKLETLNSVIYPYITAEILDMIQRFSKEGRKLILLDAPTLFESHSDDFCDIIISVLAEPEIRLKRITERDGISEADAKNRMDSQLSSEFFISRSDYIIENNHSIGKVTEISREVAEKVIDYCQNHPDII
ncbi:MAG: dephospho-CoA kinase [Ruminococcus sp.]|nr:dephospho-CoA kinase [Ruminococcus sp.]